MKTRITTLILVLTAFAGSAVAQCDEWNWPEDKAEAERKYVLHQDLVNNDQYKEAIAPHQWLLKNTPKLNKGVYIHGETIFKNLTESAQDEEEKTTYADSLMIIYDMRMDNCGERESVLDRKSIFAFKYYYKNKDTVDWILDIFEENLELNGTNAMNPNLKFYMTVVQLNKVYLKNLEDEEILAKYDYIQGLIQEKIDKTEDPEEIAELEEMMDDNDNILAKIVKFDCDKVREILGPKLEKDPDDVSTAEKIFMFMRMNECTDDPLWLEAVKSMHRNKPSFITAKVIGTKCLAAKDYECAEEYFIEGIELTDKDAEKAEMLMYLGNIDRTAGSYVAARDHYQEVIALDDPETKKDAYKNIAIMYMNSGESCKEGKSRVDDRAIYIAAYNKYKMAGDAEGMAMAKEQFPTVGDIFELNKNKGDKIRVGCWINETVVLDTRD